MTTTKTRPKEISADLSKGVFVPNHPDGLAKAITETCFQDFPFHIRPRTLIYSRRGRDTRVRGRPEGAARAQTAPGLGGQNVLVVRTEEESVNLGRMIEAISRDGYIVAQESLPAAENGDIRMVLMNGEPLERVASTPRCDACRPMGRHESNMHLGGRAEPVDRSR
jgi:glutathione synthase